MAAPQIEVYKHGHIVIDGKAYKSDVIILPEAVRDWQRHREGHRVTGKDIATLLREKPKILILGLGAGARLGLTKKAIVHLEASGVEWHALPSKEACKMYNRLSREQRVVVALHLAS